MDATLAKLTALQVDIDAQGLAVRDAKAGKEDPSSAIAKLLALKSEKDVVLKSAIADQTAATAAADQADVEALTAQLASLQAMMPKPAAPSSKKKKAAKKEVSPEEKAAADAKAAAKAEEKERKKAEKKAKKAAYSAAKAEAPAVAAVESTTEAGASVKHEDVIVSSAISGDFGLMPDLPGAEQGRVVTRFPPEPSGHLHIGHVKAMVLNHAYARRYGGCFRVRFDDTNPSNEKEEYEHAIVEDLRRLGMKPDVVSWTSDYFEVFLKHCTNMIECGDAFVDDSTAELMQAERRNVENPTAGGIDSKHRNNTVEDNMKMWTEMQKGTAYGFTCCVRAKMDMQSKNATMRDPVIYRCSATPHARTKDKYKVYPTYDLACPIVDSLEGVTHAMRDMAYADRVEQYMWFLKKLALRDVRIQDFSRINFNYTVLSKRMLAGLVDVGAVDGWDDPRMPTIKGILRRGMTVVGLRHFMLKQGASRKEVDMEWDKIWADNRKVIDPLSPRYSAIDTQACVEMTLRNVKGTGGLTVPKHPKHAELGNKVVFTAPTLLVEGEDAALMVEGEEVTLMRWGNAMIVKINKDADGKITGVIADLNLEGDVSKTKLKLTWVAKTEHVINVKLSEYDFFLNKKSLGKGEKLVDNLNEVTEAVTEGVASAGLRTCQQGSFVQLERRGFFRVDTAFCEGGEPMHLVMVPDGKKKGMSTLSTKLAHR